MHVRLKGVNSVRKRMRDGSIRIHYYAWKGGPKLAGEPGSKEFSDSYHRAHAALRGIDEDSFGALLRDYQASPEFMQLKESTRRDYRRVITRIAAEFGDLPLAALDEREVRGEFKDFRNKFIATPREADRVWQVLKRIFNVALDHGKIQWNPCAAGGKLYHGTRAEFIWMPQDVAVFQARAPKQLQGPFLAALDTGQRQGDILALRWNQFDGSHIRLTQAKTGTQVSIRASGPLKAFLEALERVSTHVFVSSHGRPWTSDGFQASFRKARDMIGLSHLNFHDLRGTFITARRREGSSIEEIASISGHAIADVRSVLERHYLAFDQAFSDAVILRMGGNGK